ncbi:uncharacterized protein [Clytia hemisphaerica]|uniref:Cas1p 10 TM acyl transferase domain-containing protein n=1 Tax=Clytia hemisphaerica TaxID=252671 RepID=A0A7M5UXI0_9CNID
MKDRKRVKKKEKIIFARMHWWETDDPGGLNYTEHNTYLNFETTYKRLPSAPTISLHQKALFTFWMSCIAAWFTLQVAKLFLLVMRRTDQSDYKHVNDDDIENSKSPKFSTKSDDTGEGEDSTTQGPLIQTVIIKIKKICFSHDKDQPKLEQFLFKMMLFGAFMFYFWLCDGLRIWPKVEKHYSRDMFVFLFFLLVFVAFVLTIRKTKDQLLVRDQTEEWKGWMQVQFVWYHYFNAQEVFNSVRVYVGAYVWMTGYGNYHYFSARKDYSIFRLLKMLFRLNFLVFCVMAVTDHTFVRYYICAMHTYWFLSVWVCMVVMNRYNKHESFILLKFFIYIICNFVVFNVPGVFEKVFTPFHWALKDDKGTLDYWKKRSTYDHWSTIVGMFVAFNFDRYQKFLLYLDKDDPRTKKMREFIRYFITLTLFVCLLLWIHYIMCKPREEYLNLHPWLSPIPICIYTWLRNMHPVLRNYHLNLFTWLGKITLETYLSQIHIYMIDSAQKILVYLPHYPMLNFTVSTLLYIAVSYQLFHLTVFFSSYMLPRNGDVVVKNIILGTVWMSLCYTLAYLLTQQRIWSSTHSGLEFLLWEI